MKKILLMALLMAACATAPGGGTKGHDAAMLETLAAANPYLRAVRMAGWVEVKAGKGWIRSKATVALERPHNFKAMFNDPVGTAWFMAVANEQGLYYAAPNEGVKKSLPRAETLSIGGVSLHPDDVITHLYPGFAPETLADARTGKGRVNMTAPDVASEFTFDAGHKVTGALVLRKNAAPLRFAYLYGNGSSLTVLVNGELRFTFTAIEPVAAFPAGFFDIPADE